MNRWRAGLIWASTLSVISIAALFAVGKWIQTSAESLKAQGARASGLMKLAMLFSQFCQQHLLWLVPLIVLFWFGFVFISAALLHIRQQALTPVGDTASRTAPRSPDAP